MKKNITSLAVLCGAIALLVTSACVHAEKVIEVVNVNSNGESYFRMGKQMGLAMMELIVNK